MVVLSAGPQIWDLDYLKKGEFLGEVRLSMQDLAERVPVDGAHEFTTALQPKPSGTAKFNRLVQGSLRFTCQVRAVGDCNGTSQFYSLQIMHMNGRYLVMGLGSCRPPAVELTRCLALRNRRYCLP